MKKVRISLDDVLVVLEAMQANGTKDIIVFDHEGVPALADADEPDNMITFQAFDSDDEFNEDGKIH